MLPFQIGEATPDAVSLAAVKGLLKACRAHHACCTDLFRALLASHLDRAPLGAWRRVESAPLFALTGGLAAPLN
jgi:hypothetical protein